MFGKKKPDTYDNLRKRLLAKYSKYRNNNLPTPYWDDDCKMMYYVSFNNNPNLDYRDGNELILKSNLIDSLSRITHKGFNYPYISMNWYTDDKGEAKEIVKSVTADSFEKVVYDLYDYPESFNIPEEYEKYYSKQELDYLKYTKKYLLFIGLKDKKNNTDNSRYKNNKQLKYANAKISCFSKQTIRRMLTGKIDFIAKEWVPGYDKRKLKPDVYQELIIDDDYDFKMLVEFTHDEIKYYKDIKKKFEFDHIFDHLKDSDRVILDYFRIVEIF